jgi:hypothetical protein
MDINHKYVYVNEYKHGKGKNYKVISNKFSVFEISVRNYTQNESLGYNHYITVLASHTEGK